MPTEQGQPDASNQHPKSPLLQEGLSVASDKDLEARTDMLQSEYVQVTGGRPDLQRTIDTPQEAGINDIQAEKLRRGIARREALRVSASPATPQENH